MNKRSPTTKRKEPKEAAFVASGSTVVRRVSSENSPMPW
jgi:hypothetical protein